jgi:outer membrane lipase/esterase
MKFIRLKAIIFATLLSLSLQAFALEFSEIYVFGDSLSDTGNLQAATQDPNIPEIFSNGPVTMEVVANLLGLPLSNSYHLLGGELPFGNNFSTASAVTRDSDDDETTADINLPTQVNAFLPLSR